MKELRILGGFAIAPLVPGIVGAALAGNHSGNFGAVENLYLGAIYLAPYTYLAAFLFGLPAFFAYRRFELDHFIYYFLGGFVGPVVAFLLFGLFVGDAASLLQWLVTGSKFGLLTAPATSLFWVIAVWQPSKPSNPALERTGARPAHHGRASEGAGRSTPGR